MRNGASSTWIKTKGSAQSQFLAGEKCKEMIGSALGLSQSEVGEGGLKMGTALFSAFELADVDIIETKIPTFHFDVVEAASQGLETNKGRQRKAAKRKGKKGGGRKPVKSRIFPEFFPDGPEVNRLVAPIFQ